MSVRIIVKDKPIDIPTAGESANWAPAITEALQTLTDAVNASVLDLTDLNIADNAQINATKIANGSVSNTDFQHISAIGAKNAANGFAGLDSSGKIAENQLPAATVPITWVDTFSGLPTYGDAAKVYIVKDTNKIYRYNTTTATYVELSSLDGIVNSNIASNASIAFSKLQTGTLPSTIQIADSNITTNASISRAKIATGTINRVVINDNNGNFAEAVTTSTELNRLSGITSSAVGISDNQTLTNKTLTGAIINAPLKLEPRKGAKVDLLQYAIDNNPSANGQFVYATDTKEYLGIKDGALTPISGEKAIVEYIEAINTTSTWGSSKLGVAVISLTSNTNLGVIQHNSSATEGSSFVALKECELNISVTGSISASGIYITKNSSPSVIIGVPSGIITSEVTSISTGQQLSATSASIKLSIGDIIRIERDSLNTVSISGLTLTAKTFSTIADALIPKTEIFAMQFKNASSTANGILYYRVPRTMKLNILTLTVFDATGASGTLTIDIKKNSSPNSSGMTTILSAPLSMSITGFSDSYKEVSGSIDSSIILTAGTWLRLDLTSIPTGTPSFYISAYGE